MTCDGIAWAIYSTKIKNDKGGLAQLVERPTFFILSDIFALWFKFIYTYISGISNSILGQRDFIF